MPTVGKEDVRMGPPQDTFIIFASHNEQAVRQQGFSLRGANASYNSGVFQIDGYTAFDIFNISDVIGTLYIHTGMDIIRLNTEANAHHWIQYHYDSVHCPVTWRVPVRTKYARVVYVNGATAQGVWEFSIQLRPYGGE